MQFETKNNNMTECANLFDPETTTTFDSSSNKEPRDIDGHGKGHLVILDSDGKQWFYGNASSAIQTCPGSGNSVDDAISNNALPPDVLSIMRSVDKVPRRPVKMRTAARRDSPPVHEIFMRAAECTNDQFWIDILQRMSRNINRKGFRFFPNSTEDGQLATERGFAGRLVYRTKSREFECNISTVPSEALAAVKAFMQKQAGITSERDQFELARQVSMCSEDKSHPTVWSDVKGANARQSLVSHFVDRIRRHLSLSQQETKDLKQTIYFCLASGRIDSSGVILRHGAIESIKGLVRDKTFGDFYVDVCGVNSGDEPLVVRSRRGGRGLPGTTSVNSVSELIAHDSASRNVESCDATNNTLVESTRQTSRRGVCNQTVGIHVTELVKIRRPSAMQSANMKLVQSDVTAGVPFTAFIDIIERVMREYNILDAKRRYEDSPNIISSRFPSISTVRQFAQSLKTAYRKTLIAPIAAAAFGYAASMTAGIDASSRAEYAHKKAIDIATSAFSDIGAFVGMPECLQRLCEAAVFRSSESTARETLESIGVNAIDRSAFDSSVFNIKRAETMSKMYITRMVRTRLAHMSDAMRTLNERNALYTSDDTSAMLVFACGTSGKRGAALRQWAKIVDTVNNNNPMNRVRVIDPPDSALTPSNPCSTTISQSANRDTKDLAEETE